MCKVKVILSVVVLIYGLIMCIMNIDKFSIANKVSIVMGIILIIIAITKLLKK